MICRSKSSWFLTFMVAASLCCGCVNRENQVGGETLQDSVEINRIDTIPVQSGADKTLYGKGAEFGMSTFSLITSDEEEYDVTRVSMDGHEGRIFGTVAPGGHYAMMMDDDGEALISLINLDELDLFVKDHYYIYNGQLVLTFDGNREWADIEELSAEKFVAKGRGGTSYSFKK